MIRISREFFQIHLWYPTKEQPIWETFLIRANVPHINHSSNRPKRASAHTGFKPCGKRVDCQVCPRSEASLTHKSLRTGREWPIKSAISCSDEFVIYCITCIKDTGICASSPHQYIGSTSNMAKTRLSKHIGSATLDSQADTTKPVGRHFRLPGHDSSHMKFLVFEKVFSRDRHVLEARGYRSILFIFPSPFQLIFFIIRIPFLF